MTSNDIVIDIFKEAILLDYSTPILENYKEFNKVIHINIETFEVIIQKFIKDVRHFEVYFLNEVIDCIYNKNYVDGYVYLSEKQIKEAYGIICAKNFVDLAIEYIFKTTENCHNMNYRVLINLFNGKFKKNLSDDELYVKVYVDLKPYPDSYSLKKDITKFQYIKI
tara:strand:+ start:231 stop:728 length:498 start_codon:yes stop_codon:yes gene_type:complete